MDVSQLGLLSAAGLLGGAVNSLAGGGSLITFPALVAIGVPPLTANVSNSVAVCPGYLAAVVGSRADLAGRGRELLALLPVTVLGTGVGAAILLLTPAAAFEAIVPFLVIAAAVILAFQQRVRRWVGHPATMSTRRRHVLVSTMVGLGSVYGGYFGAALGVMLVAGLAVVLPESLARVSALKNAISAGVGVTTVAIYALFAPVNWTAVAAVGITAMIGGYLGARLAVRLPQAVLRLFIVMFGLLIGAYLLARNIA